MHFSNPQICGTRPLYRLDVPLQLPADYHHGPRPSIWVATLPLPGQNVRNPALQDNCPPSSSEQSGGTLPPDAEGSHHMPRGPAVDRGASTGSWNPHFIQGRSTSARKPSSCMAINPVVCDGIIYHKCLNIGSNKIHCKVYINSTIGSSYPTAAL
jgi:hypothetical protein